MFGNITAYPIASVTNKWKSSSCPKIGKGMTELMLDRSWDMAGWRWTDLTLSTYEKIRTDAIGPSNFASKRSLQFGSENIFSDIVKRSISILFALKQCT